MAELFMECEEEELEPWQQKSKPIIVDDDDDDDEPIFVGEILSSKPASTYILNRVHPSSSGVAMQNGTPKRGFQPTARPAASTLAVQPQPRAGSLSGTSPGLQKPLPGGSSPQEAAKPSAGISQPVSRSTPTPSIPGNLNIAVVAQPAARPVATVTAQPVTLQRAPPANTSSMGFVVRQSSGAAHCPSGVAVTATGLAKRPAPAEVSSVSPKKAKADEAGSGSSSPVTPSVKSPSEMPPLQKGVASCNTKNGAPFPQACPKCNIHFNLLDPLKNHMKYCCPDLVHTFLGASTTDSSGASAKMIESEKGKLIMLVNDFYYGKYEGNVQQVRQEQKTHTTFKCASCMKLLKNNIRFMNHMKHHLELEKQESWESHTTCQHCFRQFPTPFQLQCHIESTHTPYESSTICRICELSFETEQILLQHMKDNHRPGEMPYVCQVCNYRSSAFSDVEKHFRAVHENTKNLLCPFCLKVVKIGAPYMHHYMRHQKKGVHRCTKCRLQFLTCKEKLDHKSQHHRTFRKPPQLEGLPPGTKVTIRASVGSIPPGSAPPPAVGPSTSTLQLSPNVKAASPKSYTKPNVPKAKPKPKPWSIQKKQSLGLSSLSSGGSGSSGASSSRKNNKIANTALSSLRCSKIQKCIECSSDIRTFASHFPAYVHCSLCRYGTSCSKAYVNHMVSFHSARQKKRFWIYKARSEELRGITTVCMNCDFVMDDSGLDKMATHLNDLQSHRCQVVVENVSLKDVAAGELSDQRNESSFRSEGEDNAQNLSRPDPLGGQEGTVAPASSGTENSAKGRDEAQLDPGGETSSADTQEEKASHPGPDHSSSPPLLAPTKDPSEEGNKDNPEDQQAHSSAAAGSEEAACPLAQGPSSGLGEQTSSEEPMESDETRQPGDQLAEGAVAAEEGGEGSSTSVSEHVSGPELSACSEDPRETAEEGSLRNHQLAEGAVVAESGENTLPSVLEPSASPGLAALSEDLLGISAEEGRADSCEDGADESSTADSCKGSPSRAECASGLVLSVASEDLRASAEETESAGHQMDEGCAAAVCGGSVAPSPPGPSSPPGLSAYSKGLLTEPVEEAPGTSAAAECLERMQGPLEAGLPAPLEGPVPAVSEDSPASPVDQCEGSSSAPAAGDGFSPEALPNPGGVGCDASGAPPGERASQRPPGASPCPSSEDHQPQQQEVDMEEAEELEDVEVDPSLASEGDVSFEQFLRRRDEPESASSDMSEQGSVHLEPLTPSEVLEHEATEILQKGGGSVGSSSKASGPGSEQAEAGASPENSPSPEEEEEAEVEASQAEDSPEAS
ncbi:zinc finger protein 280D [Heteronotia binoei]|uniref:zinc finger protein 280D n=1 Tax=Heteronotia binoei TaxID=13085 RepID=UPI00292F5E65|nr:zinc finger protein 280D [Heteronotia binoei]